ncbi:MAG: tetratricopeptide repeat protein, partial [Verrucomicrobiota bacterium]
MNKRARLVIQGTLIVLLVFLAYLPALRAGFIWDDDAYVTNNPTLHDLGGLQRIWFEVGAVPQYYPMVHTTFWLEYHLWGLHPVGYHLINVLLHATAAILLWQVLLRLRIRGAWLAAVLFALHPVCVESVAWITERKNVLSVVFYFTAALAYLRFVALEEPDGPNRLRWYWYLGALVLFIAALLSKTVTCSLPAALLLVCWWKKGRVQRGEILPLLPFFALGVGLGLMTAWIEKFHVGAQGAEWSLTFADRCLIAGRALWFYAGRLVWPAYLTFNYPRWKIEPEMWWQWLFPVAAVGVVAGLWLARRRIGRGPLVAVLFFAGTLGPALGFVNVYPMRYSFVADHFQYLASVGLIALCAAGLNRIPRIVPATVIVVLGVLTWRQASVYRNLETLWRDTLAKNPGAFLAHNNLGSYLYNEGHIEEAMEHYHKAIQINPNNCETLINLGIAFAAQGQFNEAIAHYQRALQINPDYAEAYINLGLVLLKKGNEDEAITYFQRALQIKPDFAEAHINLGNALLQKGNEDEAITHFQRALQIKPDYAEACYNLGSALLQKGDVDEAIAHFQRALQISPDYADAHHNLGCALLQKGNVDEAITHFQRALQIKPDSAVICFNLGSALLHKGNVDEAIAHYQRALQIKPDYAVACYDLGSALLQKGNVDEAITYFQRALQIKPDYAEACYNLGCAMLQKGNEDEAITHFQRALQIKPDYAEACYNLGIALTVKGRFDEAIENYRQAIQVNSNRPETFFHLGVTLGLSGRTREAVAQYREALRLNPNLAGALNKLAWALATSPDDELRNGAEAVRLAERACELTQNREPLFLGTLAAAYAESGRFPEAVATAEKAGQLATDAGLAALVAKNR